ncbi:hypothetical protein OIU77_017971 [Salix suchowensis]|uniref:Uncharacterized protein n=1 Tax=Salix suchowensis TaxID=1278906 RepID=A0ABQ8ZR66_9ROSI|nr:hypothetical protein OIU77_017971 [Salix suchowensis]
MKASLSFNSLQIQLLGCCVEILVLQIIKFPL